MTHFQQMSSPSPDLPALRVEYQALLDELREQPGVDALDRWDALRRRLYTWQSLAHVRFTLNTADEEARAEKERVDQLGPQLEELDNQIKALLLAPSYRAGIDDSYGEHLGALWEADLKSFDPVIADDRVAESKLVNRYTELLASARLPFRGETLSLSTIPRYGLDPDRGTRREAELVKWAWFAEHGAELDELFDELVKLRTEMARKLGFDSYVELGYLQMQRVDYGREDVKAFRAQVLAEVVPVVSRLRALQTERLGLGSLKAWDMSTWDGDGNPRPAGDHDWMMEQASGMFDELGPRFSEFFSVMRAAGLLDLKSKEGKAGGGYCTFFPDFDRPFIFANFNGTAQDVKVFTHECGHAFQVWSSRAAPITDYLWPTYESAEIHSMSLEFLTWPWMDRFFGAEAERFCWTHLAGALAFLPYGVAVDEFQHRVYENPEASPADRHAMWHDLERRYLPELDWDSLPYPAKGGRWQLQRHIYHHPFYYIDYTLAQTCALQFWLAARRDRGDAMERYHRLCGLGGAAPFKELVRSAGLRSPFAESCLSDVLEEAAGVLFD